MLNITQENKIIVPRGIRYISDWKDYDLREFSFPHILDKKIPGCGFTEYCITSPINIVLCSPRKILLENKEAQHPLDVLYFKNELEYDTTVDKDITKKSTALTPEATEAVDENKRQQVLLDMKSQVNDYISRCLYNARPIKILVTYDSFRIVKNFLIERGLFDTFFVVIDEMQSIFCDAAFKSDTELVFVDQLQDLQKVCYVSATPMIQSSLAELDEFKDLPYYELDWSSDDPGRVITPDLKVRSIQSIIGSAKKVIEKYKLGEFETINKVDESGNIYEIVSKEAVLYVNSVKNIIDIINKCNLLPEECNILCANTPINQIKIRKNLEKGFEIGKVPLKGEPHKMFTFCTRTVYLGADFYSTNARTFIFSDANIETLAVDITLDLPQILGRQRLSENPWKNRAELYCKTLKTSGRITKEEFDSILETKRAKTESLLRSYNNALDIDKHDLAEKYQRDAKGANYRYDYVAVNTKGGKDLVPVYNKLVMLNDKRAFDIQQTDYKDRFTVFNTIESSSLGPEDISESVENFLIEFRKQTAFYSRLKLVCEYPLTDLERSIIFSQIPASYGSYYDVLGPAKCKSVGYKQLELDKLIGNLKLDSSSLSDSIVAKFSVGGKYSKADIKRSLGDIYSELGYTKAPKASDLEDYFELRSCLVPNKETGKRDAGFEIIKKK